MLKQILIVSVVFASIPLVIQLLIKLRLLPLVVYGILVETLFADWAELHPFISTGIFVAIALLVIISWLQPLFHRISEDRMAEQIVLNGIRQAHADGLTEGQYHFSIRNGVPILEYDL